MNTIQKKKKNFILSRKNVQDIELWNYCHAEVGEKLSFTIMLNILFCLLGNVKMDYGNGSTLIISCGCCLHHSLWPTYVTITWSKKKSIYFLLNYIYIIQGFFFPPSNYWKGACVIILLRKKINLQIMLQTK